MNVCRFCHDEFCNGACIDRYIKQGYTEVVLLPPPPRVPQEEKELDTLPKLFCAIKNLVGNYLKSKC